MVVSKKVIDLFIVCFFKIKNWLKLFVYWVTGIKVFQISTLILLSKTSPKLRLTNHKPRTERFNFSSRAVPAKSSKALSVT